MILMRYAGFNVRCEPDLQWRVPEWKRKAFPAIFSLLLGKQWCPNPACPADGAVLIVHSQNVIVVNERTLRSLETQATLLHNLCEDENSIFEGFPG